MDWRSCVICGVCGGADLRCAADSNHKNGLEIYSNFLERVKEFVALECLPAKVKFSDEHDAESFMENQAKWHKSCFLKFAPSKLSR